MAGGALGGLAIGTLATVYHAAWFPWGLVGAVTLVSLFVASLRVVTDTRLAATAGALGVVGAITVLAGVDAQGSVLIAADTAGLSFLGIVTFVTVLALAWPRFSPRATHYDESAGFGERTPSQ
jgi:hypothetical protein